LPIPASIAEAPSCALAHRPQAQRVVTRAQGPTAASSRGGSRRSRASSSSDWLKWFAAARSPGTSAGWAWAEETARRGAAGAARASAPSSASCRPTTSSWRAIRSSTAGGTPLGPGLDRRRRIGGRTARDPVPLPLERIGGSATRCRVSPS
jgi:hypothetical protein